MAGSCAVSPAEFRKTLGRFVTGVTVVTTIGPDGQPRGFTANSFTSVSLTPPLILVCIAKSTASHAVFSGAEGFGVSILSQEQRDLSARFASARPDKFSGVQCRVLESGSPILDASAAWLDCAKHEWFEAGDHTILIGRVLRAGCSSRRPLGYYAGNYVSIESEPSIERH